MIIAFAVAFEHRLRFEPYIQYSDLYDLASHMGTLTKEADTPTMIEKKDGRWRRILNALDIAPENPRAHMKQAGRPLGNLPLQILSYMYPFVSDASMEGRGGVGRVEKSILDNLRALDNVLVTADKISNTPLPVACTIAISQITWIFLIVLPFQLVHLLR